MKVSSASALASTMWLGNLPEKWSTRRFKQIFEFVGSPRNGEIPLLSLTRKGIVERDTSSNEGQLAASYEEYPVVEAGTFVLNPMDLVGGWVARTNTRGRASGAYFSFRLRPDATEAGHSPSFFEHVFQTYYRERIFEPFGVGVGRSESGGGRWTLNRETLKHFPFPVPPPDEQRRIADFLDRETAKIDALIAKQEQLITTLDERRKAVIARYISQGVNRDSKLVQTGNPQVAAIPNHWSLKRLRHFALIESGADYKDFETFEDGFPVYGSGGVFAQASEYMYNGESVLFGRKGTIDRPIYVNGPFWTVDTMYWTRFNQPVNVKFVYYWATTVPFGLFTTSTALPSMTSSDIKNFFVAMPPFSEQIEIVEHLDGAVGSIDHLTSTAQKTVETLKERRQALISAAVTGKLEVGV